MSSIYQLSNNKVSCCRANQLYKMMTNEMKALSLIWEAAQVNYFRKCTSIQYETWTLHCLQSLGNNINDGNQRFRHLRKHKGKTEEKLSLIFISSKWCNLKFFLNHFHAVGSWDELAGQLWDCKCLLSRSGAAGLVQFNIYVWKKL